MQDQIRKTALEMFIYDLSDFADDKAQSIKSLKAHKISDSENKSNKN